MTQAGQQLRAIREQMGLTIRDVEGASLRIAERHGSDEYVVQLSRLSDIETKGIIPNIYKLYSLAVIYRMEFREILSWYGLELGAYAGDMQVLEPPRSHRAEPLDRGAVVRVPVRLDPGFDLRRTTNIGRMVEAWGLVPLAYLAKYENSNYTYGYVGTEDLTMYPLLLPGAFVQVDESRNRVSTAGWRSEYERPIYFVETREGFCCSWCSVDADKLVLQPHPLSPARVRMLRTPQDAEVIGQVVGVAMRLDDWRSVGRPEPRGRSQLN